MEYFMNVLKYGWEMSHFQNEMFNITYWVRILPLWLQWIIYTITIWTLQLIKVSLKVWVSLMIHSARPKVSAVAITFLAWTLFCFEKWGRTDNTCENSDHDCGSASWIKTLLSPQMSLLQNYYSFFKYGKNGYILSTPVQRLWFLKAKICLKFHVRIVVKYVCWLIGSS